MDTSGDSDMEGGGDGQPEVKQRQRVLVMGGKEWGMMRDKDICVMGLDETHMEGGAGVILMGWSGWDRGQSISQGAGFLIKKGIGYREFEGGVGEKDGYRLKLC